MATAERTSPAAVVPVRPARRLGGSRGSGRGQAFSANPLPEHRALLHLSAATRGHVESSLPPRTLFTLHTFLPVVLLHLRGRFILLLLEWIEFLLIHRLKCLQALDVF